jgi:hypothetical protein
MTQLPSEPKRELPLQSPPAPPPVAPTEKQIEDLRERRRKVDEKDQKAAEFIDKVAILGGPAAILASITFVKDIASKPLGTWAAFVLFLSWLFLIAASGFGLLSQRARRATAKAYGDLLTRKLQTNDPDIRTGEWDEPRKHNQRDRRWLDFAQGSFVVGLLLLTVFTAISLLTPPNASGESKKPPPNPGESGAAIRAGADSTVDKLISSCRDPGCVIIYRTAAPVPITRDTAIGTAAARPSPQKRAQPPGMDSSRASLR